MKEESVLTLFDAIFPAPHDNTRAGVIMGFIASIQKQIEASRKNATSADLWKVDSYSFAIRELDMSLVLSKVEIGQRLASLTTILTDPDYDADDRRLAKAGIAVLNRVGKEMKKLGIGS